MNRSPLIVIFTTVFIDLVGFGIVIPVLPFYAEGTVFNATPRMVGLLFASYSIMQLIFSPVLGRLSDRYGRRPVLLLSIIGTGIGFLVLGFAKTIFMLFLGRILDGITGGNISTAQAYIADITTKENRAKGMGLIGAAFGLGFIFGPAIGGILSRWGIQVPFFFAAALCFANAVLTVHNVSLWLRRPTYGLPFRLRWTDRGDYSGRTNRAFSKTFWRTAARDLRRALLRDQFVCSSFCRTSSGRIGGATRRRWSFFDGQLARNTGAYEPRVKECGSSRAGNYFGSNAVSCKSCTRGRSFPGGGTNQ